MLQLVRDLRQLTEAMVDAAVRLDGATLSELAVQREDLVFSLEIALADQRKDPSIGLADRDAMRTEAHALSLAEHRLGVVGGIVHDAITLTPEPGPTTYSRTGRVAS